MTKAKVSIAAGLAILTLFATGCNYLKSRDHLNKGVQAFKSAKYTQAVDHFKEAVQLDPNNANARLYLATAYMSQYIPGAESPENQQNAQAAEQEFLKVLEKEPKNTVAISSLASLHYNQAQGNQPMEKKVEQLEQAKKWYTMLGEVEPNNKESFYSLGVITWAKWYPELMSARAKLGMKPEDPGPIKDNKVREELKAKWGPTIEEGINHLKHALQIDPEYDDAMAYVNLLTRERADLAETKEAYTKDVQEADNWVQKAMETKKVKAERVAKKNASKAE
jgi:tetratricopeptide (TPR) repeat protein